MRNVARLKMGYYPLPEAEGVKLRSLLSFAGPASVIDPCVGQGTALHLVTRDAQVRRYGVELDAERARIFQQVVGKAAIAQFRLARQRDGIGRARAWLQLWKSQEATIQANLLPQSGAWKQAAPLLMPHEDVATGRPITPLHGGHVGLLCTAGLLNGVFGQGDDRHIARWRSVKHVTTFVEQDGDAEIIHHRERWANEPYLVYADGRTLKLTETPAKKEARSQHWLKRTSSSGLAGRTRP